MKDKVDHTAMSTYIAPTYPDQEAYRSVVIVHGTNAQESQENIFFDSRREQAKRCVANYAGDIARRACFDSLAIPSETRMSYLKRDVERVMLAGYEWAKAALTDG